jgi:hypothetical protein
MNSAIQQLHQQLIQSNLKLAKQLGRTSDPASADAILREMEEINFRVMMAGRLAFKETTAAIDQKIGVVIAASASLDLAIQNIQNLKNFIKAVGQFLTLVDKLLDTIKLL